jgi:hypothetical protein
LLVVGVTSHRNIREAETAAIRERVRAILDRLSSEVGSSLVVLTALAEGGDQIVAEEALRLGIPVFAVLPMQRSDYARDFADESSRERFESLLAASLAIELAKVAADPSERLPEDATGNARDRHYAEAGIYVASHSHILLAIWDGKDSALVGGTAQIVAYQLHDVLPASIERRRTRFHALRNDVERLVYHIVCSRETDDGAPAAPLHPLQTYWRIGDRLISGDEAVPSAFGGTFARMAEFDADVLKYREAIASKVELRSSAGAPLATDTAVDRLFQAADFLALHFQRRVLFAMRSIYSIAALMGIAFMCYSDLPAQDYMIFVFLALFASGISLSLVAKRRGWHRKYLDYRALAEGLRVQSYWRRAGLSVTADSEFAHDNFLQKQDVELGWIRNVMRWAGLEADLAPASREADALQRVIAEWVGEADGAGQLGYYTRRSVQRARLHRITETLGALSLWTGISISVFLAVFFLRLSQDTKTTLIVIMAVVSILAAVREAYAYRKADKELIKQYRYMCRIFSSARRALDRARDEDEQREILRALGEASLAEHAEWTLMHRERPLEHAKW